MKKLLLILILTIVLFVVAIITYGVYIYEINPCKKIGDREVYFVKVGDCINKIAATYNILPEQLQKANGMKLNKSFIKIGQSLIIPEIEWINHYGGASWYGPGFHGNKMANGQIYNQYGLSAAHKKLPLNSKIKVINLLNNLSIIVPVSDRGPYIRGRIVDLSYGAAKALKMVERGVVPVKVIPLN